MAGQQSDWRRRIHPKLRMALNGDPEVNACRAETMGALVVSPKLARAALPLQSAVEAASLPLAVVKKKKLAKDAPRSDVKVNVFVRTTEHLKLPGLRAQEGNLSILRVPLDEVENLAKTPGVTFVEQAENLKWPGIIRSSTSDQPPAPRAKPIERKDLHGDGANVLIGIIDVEGFDWLHEDFDDGKGNSRFVRIWDQGALDGNHPKGFDYGHEIMPAAMKKARQTAAKIGVSPHDVQRQSQMVPGAHGTHVASIAAGNTGVCPKAAIAAVLIATPPGKADRRKSFYDSTRLIDAINYLLGVARDLKLPVSINISLGTNGAAHDSTSALDRWIDALTAEPGRCVCVAAGNAGQERAEKAGDVGYMLGRIHTSGRIPARGLDHDIEWIVAGDTLIDVSENELEFWYEPQDLIAVSIKPPGGSAWIGPIAPGEYLENYQLPSKMMLSIYNESYHPANGNNFISIYLTPFISKEVVVGVDAGTWMVRLHGLDIRDGRFHGWIERDDPVDVEDGRYFWPSFFSSRSNVDSSSVSSLACGHRVVSVANLDELQQRINISSSQGPTRDGRLKPDVAARGTDVLAANGFGREDEPWIAMTGTSMASPFVAGVVGLMLSAERNLTAAQINGILKATAKPLPGGTYEWVNDCGFGVIAPQACVEQAARVQKRTDVKGRYP
ncbi:S8 family serine peptidase [Bradyrhizobium sp. USDA 10063]